MDAINTATLICTKNGLILAVSRRFDHNDFGLPGGKQDPEDENTLAALIREVKEETGYDVVSPMLLHVDENAFPGFIEHTYTGYVTGDINIDTEKETGVVKWVLPETVMDGSFGEYNEKVLGMLGIKRRKGAELVSAKIKAFLGDDISVHKAIDMLIENKENHDANKSIETPIAKVRNKLSPIVNYFSMLKMIENDEVPEDKYNEFNILINDQYRFIQDGNLSELLELIRNEYIWN